MRPLRPVTGARRIRTRDGSQRILDGPFAESKEVIAGYFVIEAADLQAAVAIAARCPNAEFGSVEARPDRRRVKPGASPAWRS